MSAQEIKPFMLGDKQVTSVTFRNINFMEYMKIATGITSQKDYNRRRLLATVKFDGQDVTQEQLLLIPAGTAMVIFKRMNDDSENGPVGEVLSGDANGIDAPIHYRLGTPLKMKDREVTELEFHAKTLSDIEDVVAAETNILQTVAMLKSLAVPVGTKGLTMLPEALLDQLTVSDGLKMALEIAPRFTV